MTLSEYLSLITPYHAQRPKFVNMLATLLQPLVDAQTMLAQMTADFDLDTAVGVQLDILGLWIGRSRYLTEPVTGVYFTFHMPGDADMRDGFDQGIWLGPYDPTTAVVAMPDDTYRKVLQMQAIANEWDGTLGSIQAAFNTVFPGVVIQDKGDTSGGLMSMDVLIPGADLNSLLLAVLEQDFPIKPAGVRVNIIETTVSTQPIFGFDINDGTVFGGFDVGAWGKVIQST
jgi:hypothetical protein